jgi:hypothetical protein
MEFFLGDILFAAIGWLYLFFRYRSSEKRLMYKDKEFEGMYSNVGKHVSLRFFLFGLLFSLVVFLIVAIYSLIKHGAE